MAKIDDLLKEFVSHVEELEFTAIIHLSDGTPISGISLSEDVEMEVPVAYFSEVARKSLVAANETNYGTLEDFVLTTNTHFVVMRVLPGGDYAHMAALSKRGNWGIAKVVMHKFAERFKEALP